MKLPIKLIKNKFTNLLYLNRLSINDPYFIVSKESSKLFSLGLCSLKFGKTFKSTSEGRHTNSDKLLAPYTNINSIILDIGASSGITSNDLIEKLNYKFNKYFITDYNIDVNYFMANDTLYFFNKEMKCILIRKKYFVIYPQESKLLHFICQSKISRIIKDEKLKTIRLLDPNVEKIIGERNNIKALSFNVFDLWIDDKPNVIKIANVLNYAYFKREEIQFALTNLYNILKEDGLFLVIENRKTEKGSLFIKQSGRFSLLESYGDKIDINDLVLNVRDE